jgi:hypothetical protein
MREWISPHEWNIIDYPSQHIFIDPTGQKLSVDRYKYGRIILRQKRPPMKVDNEDYDGF